MNAKLFTGVGLSLILCACATSPQPNEALETARAAVEAAQADPNVAKYDALDLEAAKQDLAVAESAAMHHNDAEVSQPAYLAAQRHASLKCARRRRRTTRKWPTASMSGTAFSWLRAPMR